MKYLTSEDLGTDANDRFIQESTGGDAAIVDRLETRVIEYVKERMPSKYDIDKIFHDTNPVRNEVLVDIISKMVLYKIFRRNAARKVSDDVKADNDWALKEIDKITAGKTPLKGLPLIEDSTGKPVSQAMFGNFSNKDFYI